MAGTPPAAGSLRATGWAECGLPSLITPPGFALGLPMARHHDFLACRHHVEACHRHHVVCRHHAAVFQGAVRSDSALFVRPAHPKGRR